MKPVQVQAIRALLAVAAVAGMIQNASADIQGCQAKKVTADDLEQGRAALRIKFKKKAFLPKNEQGSYGLVLSGSNKKMKCGMANGSSSAAGTFEKGQVLLLSATRLGDTDPTVEESKQFPQVFSMRFTAGDRGIEAGCALSDKITGDSTIAETLIKGMTASGLLSVDLDCSPRANTEAAPTGSSTGAGAQ